MKTYRVKGFAMVPVECEIFVAANDTMGAMRNAEAAFRADKARRRFIISKTADESAVHSFRSSEATEAVSAFR